MPYHGGTLVPLLNVQRDCSTVARASGRGEAKEPHRPAGSPARLSCSKAPRPLDVGMHRPGVRTCGYQVTRGT
jgi:hypothetical protein